MNWSCLYSKDFKKFSEEGFSQELSLKLTNECVNDYWPFEKHIFEFFLKLPCTSEEKIRVDHAPYDTKTLRKTVMRRSNLKIKYFKNRTPESLKKIQKREKIL